MIAVMLVGRNHSAQMSRCLESLYQSDIEPFRLYYWDNGSSESNRDVILKFTVKNHINCIGGGSEYGDQNLGMVIPRLRLLNLILQQNHSMVLDIHTDMLFPKSWFETLVYKTGFWGDPLMVAAYPSILQSKSPPTPELLESWVTQYSTSQKCIIDPIQTQPVIFKTCNLDKIGGYLDPVFHPMFVDDDDFRFRVWKSGYMAMGSGQSWVWHQGGLQSWGSESLPSEEQSVLLQRNNKLFETKHGISIKDFQTNILRGVHPAVTV